MGNLPLHPMIVHAPLVLAVAAPIVIGVVWWLSRDRVGRGRHSWIVPIVVACLAASSVVAVRTGETEEEFIEEIVAESAIETHEEAGEFFMWSTIALLALSLAAPLARAPRWRKGFQAATLAAAVGVGALAFSVGHSGGELVYEHGAAAAYAGTLARAGDDQLPLRTRERLREHVDDDDEDDDDEDGHEH